MKASEVISKLEQDKEYLEVLPTGFPTLDHALDGGFLRKELIILGGETGIGKSYITSQIMYNIAKNSFKVAYFSLEISNELILSRLIGQLSDIKSIRVSRGFLRPDENKRKLHAIGKIKAYDELMDFHDNYYTHSEIEKVVKESSYDLVVVDFIQNVYAQKQSENEMLAYVSRQFQKLAKEKNCCIMALSQLSNFVVRDSNKSHLEYKGSGGIATVADLGFFLIRQRYDSPYMSLLLRKNRRGPSGLKFYYQFTGEGGMICEASAAKADVENL